MLEHESQWIGPWMGMTDALSGVKTDQIPTPALVVVLPRVRANLRRMVAMVGDVARLRPHGKTHKMPGMARLAREFGITKHKCATIAEAEMLARAGVPDVLLSYPLVGPNIARWARMRALYPGTTFRATVDHPGAVQDLGAAVAALTTHGHPQPTLVDLDVGMGRTGADLETAYQTYQAIVAHPALEPDGIHAYDGHIRHPDPSARREAVETHTRSQVRKLMDRLRAQLGVTVPRLVLGGTPTFPIHAEWREASSGPGPGPGPGTEPGPLVECSPGTCVFHDYSYATLFPDLPFQIAAAVWTRVISRPRPGRICLDLGYKAVAADPTPPRVNFPLLPDATIGPQSEEHLILDLDVEAQSLELASLTPGTVLVAVPAHICPTCALYRSAYVVDQNQVVDIWDIEARDRFLTC